MSVSSVSLLLRVSQLRIFLAVLENEVSTNSEEEKIVLEVESIYLLSSHSIY